ncbi:MAG: hypothetical protein HY754_02705 [Nitrospirae bacterium]|nr:hypothetical protein [Nitrospirota bacterium]
MGTKQLTINKEELYGLIKEAVREVIHEESFELFLKNIPPVSEEEMRDIQKQHGKPSLKKDTGYSEFVKI